jgi:hypothetical protein
MVETPKRENKTYLVKFQPPSSALQHVQAASFEMHGEHLVFLTSKSKLAAIFSLKIVQSWSESPTRPNVSAASAAENPVLPPTRK